MSITLVEQNLCNTLYNTKALLDLLRSNIPFRFGARVAGATVVAALTTACAGGPIVRSLEMTNTTGRDVAGEARIAGYYALPRALYPLTLSRSAEGKATITFGAAAYVPDSSRLYAVEYTSDDWSTDQITVETDGQGLLKSVAPISTDVTGEIIGKVIELGKEVMELGVAPFGPRAQQPLVRTNCGIVEKQYLIDPAASGAERSALEAKIERETCFEVRSSPMAGSGSAKPLPVEQTNCPTATENVERCVDGIFYRPSLPYQIEVIDQASNAKRTYLAMAPSPDMTMVATLDRKAFTGLHTTLTFSNGMLTKFESTDPNQAIAALQIPIDVLKAIVSIPAELLTVKVKNIKDESAYLDAQRALIEAQNQLAAARKAQEDARRQQEQQD